MPNFQTRRGRSPAWLLILAFVLCGSVQAAEPHVVEYSAYRRAFEAGDVAAALRHGENAWSEAERALGDDPTTAVLAYNYARLAFAFPASAERAQQAYERALSLSERGIGDLSTRDVRIGLAEVRLIRQQSDGAAADDLARLLTERRESGQLPSDLSAHAWKTLAIARMRDMRHDEVLAYADIAAAEAAALQPPDQQVQVDALVLGAMARLSRLGPEKDQTLINQAIDRLDRVIALYPAQAGIDGFDPLLAKALMWRASVQAMVGVERDPVDLPSLIRMQPGSRPSGCPDLAGLLSRTDLVYPQNALDAGRVGAVLVGLDFNGTGVERVVVLAEPAGTGFGAATEESLQHWTLSQPVSRECGRNHVTFVTYSQQ